MARSIYTQESGGGRNTKTSNRGARGGMQIIPSTFADVADKDWSIDNPEHNARAGIRYLKKLDKQAGGDPALVAAGYYGGPGGLEKARKGVAVSDPKNPDAPNTLQYAQQVVGRLPSTAQVASSEIVASPPSFGGGMAQVPPELLAHRNVKVAALPDAGSDAWAAFLRAMPQTKRPVQVADLDFSLPRVQIQAPQTPSPRSTVPNFAAFKAWQGLA